MAIFVVVSDRANPAVDAKIAELYDDDSRFKLNPSTWLVSADKLVEKIAEEIGLTTGESGRAVVFRVGPYFGWHSKATWEWLSLKDDT